MEETGVLRGLANMCKVLSDSWIKDAIEMLSVIPEYKPLCYSRRVKDPNFKLTKEI